MDLTAAVRRYADAHFYESNMDIVAGWTDAELGAVIAEAKTARWAITLAWRAVRDIDRTSPEALVRYGRAPVKVASLLTALAAKGGLKPDPELAAILDGPHWVGGFGPLVRRNGMALDDAREVAVGLGYLPDTPWSGGVSTSTVNELLDAIREEAHGRKVYPMGEYPEEPDAYGEDDPANYAEESCYDDCPF